MALEWVHYSTSREIFLGTQLPQLGEWDESHQHYHTTAIAVDRRVQGGWQRDQTPIKLDHLDF